MDKLIINFMIITLSVIIIRSVDKWCLRAGVRQLGGLKVLTPQGDMDHLKFHFLLVMLHERKNHLKTINIAHSSNGPPATPAHSAEVAESISSFQLLNLIFE